MAFDEIDMLLARCIDDDGSLKLTLMRQYGDEPNAELQWWVVAPDWEGTRAPNAPLVRGQYKLADILAAAEAGRPKGS